MENKNLWWNVLPMNQTCHNKKEKGKKNKKEKKVGCMVLMNVEIKCSEPVASSYPPFGPCFVSINPLFISFSWSKLVGNILCFPIRRCHMSGINPNLNCNIPMILIYI